MRRMVPWLLVAALPWPTACSVTETFACNADAQCVTDAAAGRCEPEGVCSFPDGSCDSGHRYGGLAGELSGECVGGGSSSDASTTTDPGATSAPPVESLDGDSSSGSSTSSTSSTSTSEPPGATSEPPGSTSEPGVETATTTTTDGSSSSGPGPDLDPYGPCMDASDCVEPDSYCHVYNDTSVCVPPCDTDEDCPPALEPGSAVLCMSAGGTGCVLICTKDIACPDGMRCEPIEKVMGVGYCAW